MHCSFCNADAQMGYSHTTALVTTTHQLLIQPSLAVKPFTTAFFFFSSVWLLLFKMGTSRLIEEQLTQAKLTLHLSHTHISIEILHRL